MKFRITLKDVSLAELPEVIDYLAGRHGTVTVCSEKTSNRFQITTTWQDDLEATGEQISRLSERLAWRDS